MQPPELDERPESRSSYVEGTDGMVELTASSRFVGKFAYPPGFGAMAQFAIIGGGGSAFGEIVDPLDGIDDCGVFIGAGLGTAGTLDLYDAADVRLLDGSTARPFALSEASHDDFYSYILELDTQNVKPRFGASYGVHVSGGSFGAAFDSGSGLHLPQELAIHELQSAAHLEQTDLHLTWTGSGEQPLFVQLLVGPTLQGFFSNYEMQCLLKDDGEFVIPAEVLRAMPAGFASATFAREDRRIVKSGAHSLLLFGSVQATHRFALGPLSSRRAWKTLMPRLGNMRRATCRRRPWKSSAPTSWPPPATAAPSTSHASRNRLAAPTAVCRWTRSAARAQSSESARVSKR
jgi:hypothetical protein